MPMARYPWPMLKKLTALAALAVLAGLTGLWMAAGFSREPMELGLQNGRLRPCPESPNCVSSDGASGDAQVAPLQAGPRAGEAFTAMRAVLMGREDCEIVAESATYLHATARTGFFGFIDDVELHLDVDAATLHIRSASRVGRSDLGANARRVAELRLALEERLSRGTE